MERERVEDGANEKSVGSGISRSSFLKVFRHLRHASWLQWDYVWLIIITVMCVFTPKTMVHKKGVRISSKYVYPLLPLRPWRRGIFLPNINQGIAEAELCRRCLSCTRTWVLFGIIHCLQLVYFLIVGFRLALSPG